MVGECSGRGTANAKTNTGTNLVCAMCWKKGDMAEGKGGGEWQETGPERKAGMRRFGYKTHEGTSHSACSVGGGGLGS